jgi:hypothetical protein
MKNNSNKPATKRMPLHKLRYAANCLPSFAWQRLTRSVPHGVVHLVITVADHFEPSSMPGFLAGYAARDVQEKRLETWCRDYPRNFAEFRDAEGHRFSHTYFFPAEQYDKALVQRLAEFCRAGWGEIEVHLHHGLTEPTTAEETENQLVGFRDALAQQHGCLSYEDGDPQPKYAFIHGNFTLANCANGFACGVDNEMQLLAETGCYVDMTYPTAAFHPAQIAIINSIYECALPLNERAPQRLGRKLRAGRPVTTFPFLVQGPWMLDFDRSAKSGWGRIENGALTGTRPPTLRRLALWKKAGITVRGRPDWIFIKLHTHGMAPADTDTMLGAPVQHFLKELIGGAAERKETLHFVSAREMANIILAACDGREGNPSSYRDYRYRRGRALIAKPAPEAAGLTLST